MMPGRALVALLGFEAIGICMIVVDLSGKRNYGHLDKVDGLILLFGLLCLFAGFSLYRSIRTIERFRGKDAKIEFGSAAREEENRRIDALLAKADETVRRLKDADKL